MIEIRRAAVTGLFALWLAPLSGASAQATAAAARPEPVLEAPQAPANPAAQALPGRA